MSACAEQEVGGWLQTIVGEFGTHLRDFIVLFSYIPGSGGLDYARIQAQYHPSRGLTVTGSIDKWDEEEDSCFRNIIMPFVGMPAYTAALERTRVRYKEQGEIIVEFFGDWDALRQACSGPGEKLLWLDLDEYGKRTGAPLKQGDYGIWRREG